MKTPPPSDAELQRYHQLAVALARLSAKARLRPAPSGELDLPRQRALWWLRADGPLTVSALAERLDVSLPTASRMVDELHGRGLLARQRDPEDRRRVMLEVTPAGAAHAEALDASYAARFRASLTLLEPEERAQLLDLLERMLERLAERAAHLP
ncbi:MAG: MarR family transcriptional regulator [Alphaproteobacteria bacterium]|nr:MarR family transcriptional regulator [Alphaproteobacteria bacterium]